MEHLTETPIAVFELTPHSEDQLLQKEVAFVMEGWMLGLCNQGHMEFQVNQEIHQVDPGFCFSWMPGQICSIRQLSDDASISMLHASSDSLLRIRPHLIEHSPATSNHIKEHIERLDNQAEPNVHQVFTHVSRLPEATFSEVSQLLNVLRNHVHPHCEDCDMDLASSLIEAIIRIMVSCHHQPVRIERTPSRQEILTKEFFAALIQHHREEHNISFYAKKACVTPKYLSAVISQVTGHTAQEWVERVLLFSAKRLLKSTDLSVAQVADHLHFSSSSSFVRFFRVNAGVTPKEYRINQQ